MTSKFIRSDKILAEFDKAMINIKRKCIKATNKILQNNKDKLKKLKNALLKKEVLYEDEIYKIIGKPVNEVAQIL